ncbi:MAG: preprotein translocase subunit SecA [Gemmatimonadota bacterium]
MLKTAVKAILGSRHEREAKKLGPLVDEINAIVDRLGGVSDDELRAQTERLREIVRGRTAALLARIDELRETKRSAEDHDERERLSADIRVAEEGLTELTQAVLDEILPEAFATVKEACRRLLGTEIDVTGQTQAWDMVPYDVQLIGAVALHRGKATEMQTGEGKTLVATMPLYLNALAGRGAHLVTVNSYLAQRDAEWMGTVYRYLGLSVDCIDLYEPGTPERRAAYAADICYGTNNEFGFDYLRDNMVPSLEQKVQRGHYYAIIDEVDSILIDEARTPLIISGPVAEERSHVYKQYDPMVGALHRKQMRIVAELVGDAERALEAGNEVEAGEKLLAVRRGAPKNKRLLKLFADDPGLQKLVSQTEAAWMREKKLHELDELLFFAMDEKGHQVHLSDRGLDELSPGDPDAFLTPDLSEDVGAIEDDESIPVDQKRERIQALESEFAEKSQKIHVIHQLLKAYTLFTKDEQYIVEDGQVVIVDEFTGRKMAGRRWSDGLHQAVEAKESVSVRGETQTLATITIQNYFRMYDKLAGMTGTAETEENEFHQIYNLDVMVIPTNRPVVRDDRQDLIFRTKREKFNGIMDEVERLNKLELPVLVGTTSVDVSETLSRMLKRRGIKHNVLNAKFHQQESEIVREAGQPRAVTIATNMAGRGTDIKLGAGVTDSRTIEWIRSRDLDPADVAPIDPNRWVEPAGKAADFEIEDGGLHIIGSERHESRRIDRQLRGRAGRQGDPGASQFFLSLEDDLMRLFNSDRVAAVMDRMGAEEGEVITHALVTRSIEKAQQRVEMQNFEARKRLLDYDDVMNQQREVVYDLRTFALEGGEDLKGEIWDMASQAIEGVVDEYVPEGSHDDEWEVSGLEQRLVLDYLLPVAELRELHDFANPDEVQDLVLDRAHDGYHKKLEQFAENQERVLAFILLSVLDGKWRDHLYDLDHLKASIGFRSWGQKDPLIEYKKEAFDMFVDLMADVRRSVASLAFRAQIGPPPPQQRRQQPMTLSGPGGAARPATRARPSREDAVVAGLGGGAATATRRMVTNRGDEAPRPRAPVSVDREPGRNDPCPCGSGKKYKKCHGAVI